MFGSYRYIAKTTAVHVFMGINASLSDMCISCTLLIKATYFIVTYCFNSRTIRVNWALLNFPVRFDFSSPVDWFLLLFTALTRTSQPSRHFVHRMPRRASVFCVSPPGIHISLVICVWGYTYHGDTHITVRLLSYLTKTCHVIDLAS